MARLRAAGLLETIRDADTTAARHLPRHAAAVRALGRRRRRRAWRCSPAPCGGFRAATGRPVPHMGWNTCRPLQPGSAAGRHQRRRLLLFRAQLRRAGHGGHQRHRSSTARTLAAVVGRGNFHGVQFHPERSGPAGARVLRNFLELLMLLIPSIDLRGGHCVRLRQGDFRRRDPLRARPPAAAAALSPAGRALAAPRRSRRRARRAGRQPRDARRARGRTGRWRCRWAAACARRASGGRTAGARRGARGDRQRRGRGGRTRSRAGCEDFGPERICLAFDVRLDAGGVPLLRTRGWRQSTAMVAVGRRRALSPMPDFAHVLCTDIERDGALAGPNIDAVSRRGGALPAAAWQASGRRRRHRRPARARRRGRGGRDQRHGPARGSPAAGGVAAILARRIIPCLDVRDGQVVKGVRFRDHRVVGDILELARRYRDAGADELVFYDITASPEGRSVDRAWVSARGARARHSLLRGRRHPLAWPRPRRCWRPARRRSR